MTPAKSDFELLHSNFQSSMPILPYLHRVVSNTDLGFDEAQQAMRSILLGEVETPVITAFLTALRMKGETASEVAGFVSAMRQASTPVIVAAGDPVIDTCGTGGDGAHTFNISTVASFIVAGAGIRVAKHGNRAISSRSGSADVLEKLGIPLIASPEFAAQAIDTVGIGFLFAPAFHPAVKQVMPARAALKMRTVFNLLGPLANPAMVRHQVIGVPGLKEAEMISAALVQLGMERGFVVHGEDGLDEVTTTGRTAIFEVNAGKVTRWDFHPEQLAIDLVEPGDLAGGDAAENAEVALRIFQGEQGPKRDIVLVNAAFAILVAGRAATIEQAYAAARQSLDSGAALARLQALQALSAEYRPAV